MTDTFLLPNSRTNTDTWGSCRYFWLSASRRWSSSCIAVSPLTSISPRSGREIVPFSETRTMRFSSGISKTLISRRSSAPTGCSGPAIVGSGTTVSTPVSRGGRIAGGGDSDGHLGIRAVTHGRLPGGQAVVVDQQQARRGHAHDFLRVMVESPAVIDLAAHPAGEELLVGRRPLGADVVQVVPQGRELDVAVEACLHPAGPPH